MTEFATVIVPLGNRLDKSEIEALDAYLTVESVNDGSLYVQSSEAVEAYGWIEKTVTWDNVSDPEVLLEKAKEVFGGVQTVVCASADKFVGTVSEKNRIRADFNADVCDMECAGVLITADANGVPALIVKAVSDGDGGANDYLTTVHEATRQYIDFLINFIKTIE